jgi:hypothetical protein
MYMQMEKVLHLEPENKGGVRDEQHTTLFECHLRDVIISQGGTV